jgi:hypothetical protein
MSNTANINRFITKPPLFLIAMIGHFISLMPYYKGDASLEAAGRLPR